MAKKSFQDIIPPGRRSIRNISLPRRDEISDDVIQPRQHEIRRADITDEGDDNSVDDSLGKKGFSKIWYIAVVCVAILVVSVTFLISKANVSIELKHYSLTLDTDISATKTEGDENVIKYATIELSKKGSVNVKSDNLKEVSSYATGQVAIYNNQATSQTLVAGTRLSDPSGKIFKTDKAITIAARTVKSGETIPGSALMTVKAEKAGSSYNVGLVDLKVVAFKGDPRYESVYARSKTSLGGGQIGRVAVLGEEELSAEREKLKQDLTEKILAEARAQVPDKFILPDDSFVVSITNDPPVSNESEVLVGAEATFKGFIFDKQEFAKKIGEINKIEIATNDLIEIDTSNVKVTAVSEKADTLTMHMVGPVEISYRIDEKALKNDLQGKSKKDAMSILSTYPAIASAKITTSPLWKIPDNSDRITVTVSNTP